MTFRPPATSTTPGRSAIDLHDDDGRYVATIYATRTGLNILTAPDHVATDLAIEVQSPEAGVQFSIRPRSRLSGFSRKVQS